MDSFSSIFNTFAKYLKEVLPLSPFTEFIDWFSDLPFLGWLNWFFPVKEAMQILVVWLSAIAIFYLYSIILRWIKAID